MNVFAITIRHTTEVLGQAETKEDAEKGLAGLLAQLKDPEVLGMSDLGPSEAFFADKPEDEFQVLPTVSVH